MTSEEPKIKATMHGMVEKYEGAVVHPDNHVETTHMAPRVVELTLKEFREAGYSDSQLPPDHPALEYERSQPRQIDP